MGNYRFFHGFFNVSIWIKTTKIEHLVCNCSFLFAAHNGVHHIHSVHLSSLELHLQILGIHKLENLWLAWPHSIGLRMQGKKREIPSCLGWICCLFFFHSCFWWCVKFRWGPCFSSAKESPSNSRRKRQAGTFVNVMSFKLLAERRLLPGPRGASWAWEMSFFVITTELWRW